MTSTNPPAHPNEPEIPTVASTELIFENKVIRLDRDMIRFHDGHEAERVVIRHPGAVALVVVDDDGRWLLIRQYRHPAGKPLLEIPAGTREDGEPPEHTAAREVREETGYDARELVPLGWVHPNPAIQNNRCHSYLARGAHLAGDPDPDPSEELEVTTVALDEIPGLIDGGRITHSLVICAFHLLGQEGGAWKR